MHLSQLGKWQHSLFLLLALVVLLIHFQFFHGGYLGYDDLEYMKLTAKLIKGEYQLDENLYTYRWAVVFPLALAYSIFGINDFSNVLIFIVPFLLICHLCLKLMAKFSAGAKLIAVLFVLFLPLHLVYVEKPMPDIWVELGFLLCFYGYYNTRFQVKSGRLPMMQFLLGALVMFLSKESFLVIYPYFFLLLMIDLKKRRNLQFWKGVLIGLVAIVTLYFIGQYALTGNAFARISAIFHNRYISACSYDLQPIQVLIDRIAYKLWIEFIRNGVLVPLGFLIYLRKSTLAPNLKFIGWSALAMLLLSNFMTILYTSYVPLCNDARHFMFVIPLIAVAFAVGVDQMDTFTKAERMFVLATLLVQLLLSIHLVYENTWYLYIPLLGAIIAQPFLPKKWMFVAVLSLGLFAQFVQRMHYNTTIHYAQQRQLFEDIKQDPAPQIRIITDPCNEGLGAYYYQFDSTRVRLYEYKEFSSEMRKDKNVKTYIYLNGMTAFLAGMGWEDYPEYVHNFEQTMTKVKANLGGELFLWKPE